MQLCYSSYTRTNQFNLLQYYRFQSLYGSNEIAAISSDSNNIMPNKKKNMKFISLLILIYLTVIISTQSILEFQHPYAWP